MKKNKKQGMPVTYEKALFDRGFSYICGVDEVGRGPWAGPIVAAATIVSNLKSQISNLGVRDSKKLSEKKREDIFEIVKDIKDIEYFVAFISAEEIDKIGLGRANQLVLKKAVDGLSQKPDYVLVDGFEIGGLTTRQEKVVGGDSKIFSIALASIIAKVSRDRYMKELAKKYPEYGFEHHKGYGTAKHLGAIKKYGICPEHRKSFHPIHDIIVQ
ncbi:ribonuclease HII [Candidatus Microgenomates bacterium]|nr:ribonuclease HII [Candidatus Microgenomates bacterium]